MTAPPELQLFAAAVASPAESEEQALTATMKAITASARAIDTGASVLTAAAASMDVAARDARLGTQPWLLTQLEEHQLAIRSRLSHCTVTSGSGLVGPSTLECLRAKLS